MALLLAFFLGLLSSPALGQLSGGELSILRGVLLSHDGKPVHGAFLYLDPPEGDLPQHLGAGRVDRPDGFSGENGRFFIAKSPGKYRLTVWIGKERVFVTPVELKGGEQKVEIRLPVLPALYGKLVDEGGNPMPQMMVTLENSTTKERRVAISDSNGEFVFLLPPSGEAIVSVMSVSQGSEEKLAEQKVVIAGGKDERLTLRLPKLPRLTIRILKRDGKPLANSPVVATVGFASSDLKTDSKGHVTLPPMPSTGRQKILLRTKNEGWAVISIVPTQIPSQPLEVRLQPFSSVSGKLVTPEGKPVEGVEVLVNPVTPNPFPLGNLEQSARTDAQGQFRVNELWAGNYSVRVRDDRYRLPGLGTSFWLAPGQHKTLTLVATRAKNPLQKTATIVGRVLSADGKPIPDATVQLDKQLPSPWGVMGNPPGKPVKTDEQGRFELTDVTSGWHVLSARTKDGKDAVQWVYVPAEKGSEKQKVSVTLQIPKEFGSIKGRVFKDGGKTPAAGVGLMAIESHYYLINMWDAEQAVMNLQVDENQTICVGGG